MTLAVIIVSAVIVVTIVGQIAVRQIVKSDYLADHQGMVEAMLGVVGTLFSVLLGLLVAGAIDTYHDVKMQVSNEANAVANVFRMARGLSDVDRPRIRQICRQYGKVVVEVEWPTMDQKHELSAEGWDSYRELWEAVVAVTPEMDRQNNIHQAMLSAMEEVGVDRRARAVSCASSLSPILWAAISIGSLITIVFTYLFSSKLGALHTIMTALIAASLGLNIWLLAAYSSPFTGELQIRPDMFGVLQKDVFNSPDTPSRYLSQPVKK